MTQYDLAIIGAGPAGMAAAIEACAAQLSVVVLDEQPAPGGQVFRAVEAAKGDPALAGEFSRQGADLVAAFRKTAGINYQPATTLWHAAPASQTLSLLHRGAGLEIGATAMLLATGAQERPVPIPGWTLPGVMTAGALQILLKTTGAIPKGPVVIAGQGPLCWLLAVQLLRAGVASLTLLETRRHGPLQAALSMGGLWAGRGHLAKGLALVREARSRGLRVVRDVRNLRVLGEGRIEQLVWDQGEMPCAMLALHEGVIPSTHVTRALGLEHEWDEAQLCWRPVLDGWGKSSNDWIAVAGDGGGIGGWEAASAGGALAALGIAQRLGRIDPAERDRRARPHQASRQRSLALRPFLDRLYRPAPEILAPKDDSTVICRCEEVTAGQVRAAARLGATGPNQAKAYLRTGMGPCQGRMCGTTVAALIADENGVPVAEVSPLRARAPFKPLTVGALLGVTAAPAESE